mgnify:CR=1 FL=1
MREITVGISNRNFSSNRSFRNEHYLFFLPFYTTLKYFKNMENLYFLFIGIFQLLTFSKIGINSIYPTADVDIYNNYDKETTIKLHPSLTSNISSLIFNGSNLIELIFFNGIGLVIFGFNSFSLLFFFYE